MLGRHIYMKTGVFSGAFMYGRRSRVAIEEIKHTKVVEKIIDFLGLVLVVRYIIMNGQQLDKKYK